LQERPASRVGGREKIGRRNHLKFRPSVKNEKWKIWRAKRVKKLGCKSTSDAILTREQKAMNLGLLMVTP
jgi:hypothetical protein